MANSLRNDRLFVLLTAEERIVFEAAAQTNGETLSAWIRTAARQRALREKGMELGMLEDTRKRKRK